MELILDNFDSEEGGFNFGQLSNLVQNATKDEHEKKFMENINFTDEMYEIIQDEEIANELQSYCINSMDEVGQNYRVVHGYISLIVCLAGILMNILIIMVLTRKEMASPVNRMLTALAIADMLVMIEYIPFTLHMYVFDLPEERQYSYSWAVFVLFHSHFTQILHTINIQLTISMSIWRYVALKCSGRTSTYLTFPRCNLCILAAYICPIIICIPNYLTFSIYHKERLYLKNPYHFIFKKKEVSHMKNFLKLCKHTGDIMNIPINCDDIVVKQDWYTVGLSGLAKANNELLHRINFWIFSVFVKLIPCFILTFFMCWLVNALYKTKRRYKMLQTAARPLTSIAKERGNSVNMHRVSNISIPDGDDDTSMMMTNLPMDNHSPPQELNNLGSEEPIKPEMGKLSPPTHLSPRSPSLNSSMTINASTSNVSLYDNGVTVTTSLTQDGSNSSNCQPRQDSARRFSRRNLTRVSSLRRISNMRKRQHSNASANNNHQDQQRPALAHQNTIKNNSKKAAKRTDRTSRLLIAVLCLFLITEIPQGIMAFLSGIYGEQFFRNCYNTWAEVWDILALMNSAINFILYCFMSKQFRLQFHLLFKVGRFFKPKWINNMANCNLHNPTISTTV